MELKEGMYARTEEGTIFKVSSVNEIDVDGIWYKALMGDNVFKDILINPPFKFEMIEKASNNIIDLIEVGDVIVDEVGNKYPINYEFETDYNDEYQSYEITIDDNITLFFKDGLSIVTKEQFESISYKVKE